jgi:hypothetical protein
MKTLLAIATMCAGSMLCTTNLRADASYIATLTTAQETPPHVTAASGTATLTYSTSADDLAYTVTFADLSAGATEAHIHFGLPGVAGPVILPLTLGPALGMTNAAFSGILTSADLQPDAADGVTTFAQAIADLAAGDLYVNVHDTTFPAGEIRGQVSAVGQSAVPEPGTVSLTLAAAGLALSAGFLRRRTS